MSLTPGFFAVSSELYHADILGEPDGQPSLSASIAALLLSASPKHAWTAHPKLNPDWRHVDDRKFDVGRVAHQVLLEGNANIVVVDAADWRTNAAKETRDEARAADMTPLLAADWENVQAMVAAAREQLDAFPLEPRPFTDGKPEQTIVWHEPNGVCCKARLDWLRDDRSAIDDLKTTSRSANPESWTRSTMYGIGADLQAAFYLRGMERLTGARPDWRFVVVETFPPYALAVVSPGPSVLELANAKVEHAIEVWERCLSSDEWPAYPQKVAWAEAPAWEMSHWLEREAREEVAA